MFTKKEIEIKGLEAIRSELITSSRQVVRNLEAVNNPLEYLSFIQELNYLKDKFNYIEKQLDILDSKRNECPF